MDEGILSLRWNNHRSTFFHILSTLHQKELYSDVTIACEGKFFPVHKLVLSVCSEYFEDMFKKTNCKHPIIVLKDILSDELEALLNYMYVGEANVAQSDLARLIKAAECLRIKGLAVPDENPESHETKRPNSCIGKEDTSAPKRRKQDESQNKYPSTSREGHNDGRRDGHNNGQSFTVGESDNSHQSTSSSPTRNSPSSPHRNQRLQSQERRNTSNHGGQVIAEVVLEDEAVVKTEPKIEEEIILENESLTFESDKQGGIHGGSQSYDVKQGGIRGGSQSYDVQPLNQEPHNVLQDMMTQGIPQGTTESIPHWENSGGNNLGGVGGFSLEGYSPEDSSSRASQQMEWMRLGIPGNTFPYNATQKQHATTQIKMRNPHQDGLAYTSLNNASSSSQISTSENYFCGSEPGNKNYSMNVQRPNGTLMSISENKYGLPEELIKAPTKEERAHASQVLNCENVTHTCLICKKVMKNCYKTVIRPHYEQDHKLPQDITYRILRIL